MFNLPKPLVTVVIPCHNYARFVADAIRSVQSQTLNNLECFIVNDSSIDNSEEVIKAAIQGDSRFMLLTTNHASLSASRNMGIKAGSAPFIACLDADDCMGSEEYLEVLVSELEKDRTVGIGFTSLQVMDENRVLGHVPPWPNGFSAEQQYNHVNQIPSLCVFRRDAWERAGGFRVFYQYVEDAEFWTTVIDIGFSAKHVTTMPWFHYRLHNKSASQVHRTGEIPEPDWLEYHPWSKTDQKPFAAAGNPHRGSWPVRFYHEPDVTIIIPVGKGHEETVKDALHSVEGQTHRSWECIVVDDTWGGLSKGLDLTGFPWAKVYSTKGAQDAGAGAARNLGLNHAQGDYVVFLDADDMLKPDFLSEALEAYRQNGKYVYTDWLSGSQRKGFELHETPEYSFEAVRDKPSLHPITALIPRRWALNVGGFDEGLPAMEDVDFFMRLFTHGYCGVRVAKPLMIYNLETGTRRHDAESPDFQRLFKALLKNRYGKFMEDNTMCDCVTPPKGLQPAAPTLENADQYRETYGEIVMARLQGRFTPIGAAEFRGPATRVSYGRRAKGDVFYIWEADLKYGDDTFELVDNYGTDAEPTVVPPTPPTLSTTESIPLPNPQLPGYDLGQGRADHNAAVLGVPASQFAPPEIIPPAPAPSPNEYAKAEQSLSPLEFNAMHQQDRLPDLPPAFTLAEQRELGIPTSSKGTLERVSGGTVAPTQDFIVGEGVSQHITPGWRPESALQSLPDELPVVPDDEDETADPDDDVSSIDAENDGHKTTVGERNDTLPPEPTEEEIAEQKRLERNRRDRERRAAAKKAAE